MSRVSVIIPVYNVEKDVEACLRSVMTQTYADLEILVCDDGSTDMSGAICDRIALEDHRVHVIHTSNEGLSAARNTCLNVATGDYVTFVDSDDLIAADYVARLWKACDEHHAEIAICDYQRFPEDENTLAEDDGTGEEVYTNVECLEYMYHPKSPGMSFISCAKLYKRTLFEDLQIRFPVGKLHEDQFTTYRLIYAAQRIVYVQSPMYGYRTRGGSIMTKSFRIARIVIVEATREQCDLFLSHGEHRLSALAVNNHIRTEFSILANLRELGSEEARGSADELIQEIRTDCKQYLPQVDLPAARKLVFRLAAMMPMQPIVQRLRMF